MPKRTRKQKQADKKRSASMKARWEDPEYRSCQRSPHLAACGDPTQLNLKSQIAVDRWMDAGYRKKQAQSWTAARRRKCRKRTLEQFSGDDGDAQRQHLSETMRKRSTERWNDPEIRTTWVQRMHRTHGMSKSPEYTIWKHMRRRCVEPKESGYQWYGARGIKVHVDWCGKNGFQAFYDHVGPRPSPKHSLDRIDNSKGYMPNNVRWATAHEQANNTSLTHKITIDGATKSRKEWAAHFGINYRVVCSRHRSGWSEEKLFLPVKKHSRIVEIGEVQKTLAEWASEAGINFSTLSERIRRGLPESRWLLPPQKGGRPKS